VENSPEINDLFFKSEFYMKWLEISKINNDLAGKIPVFGYNKVVYEQKEEKKQENKSDL
jgi:hypothetical protein